uniref:Zf-U1 domain-containing protein n=1 Tax=Mesocestoides corti TaxID=53468 RepID=A0A5K3F5N8_MESCO
WIVDFGLLQGRRYYCDYCETSFPDSLVNRRNHLKGARHVQIQWRCWLRSEVNSVVYRSFEQECVSTALLVVFRT